MGQAGMKNNWKRNTRYMGVFAVLAAVFCMIVVLNINTGNVQISVPEILRILFLEKRNTGADRILSGKSVFRSDPDGRPFWEGHLPFPDFYCRPFLQILLQDRLYWGFLPGAKMMVALAMIYLFETITLWYLLIH